MVNRERLRSGALRAYELGRLRSAAKAAWFIAPAAIVCGLETGRGKLCCCLGALLISGSVFLRWRNRQGADSVRSGLLAGGVPLLVGLLAARLVPSCAGAPLLSVCTLLCLVVGTPAGIGLGLSLSRGALPLSMALAASGIAVLAASLGCAGLGFAGGGMVLGVLLGAVPGIVTTLSARRSSSFSA